MKSIMQKKDGRCYLCMMLYNDYSAKPVQEHHVIFGRANRKLSEKYGLKVYLCIYHHTEGPEAVHRNAELSKKLKVIAQRTFRETFPELDWMSIFGKNYDTEPEGEPVKRQQDSSPGFMFLEVQNGKCSKEKQEDAESSREA